MEEKGGQRPTVVLGKDTRISSDVLEGALVAGLCSAGADVLHLGVFPTPAVAFAIREASSAAHLSCTAFTFPTPLSFKRRSRGIRPKPVSP